MKVWTLYESAQESVEVFKPWGGERAQLIQTGFGPLDTAIGGIFPGSCAILGGDTGIGKSSLILTSALGSNQSVGIISTEDTPDVLGTRILAARSGVDSLKIRKGTLSAREQKALKLAHEALQDEKKVYVAYATSCNQDGVIEATRGLADKGCKLIWLDYIQKVRGKGDDRRNEVASTFTAFQRGCAAADAAGFAVSQFSRRTERDASAFPRRHWLKESGDLENEARLILLAWRDAKDRAVVHVTIDKSTVGGEGTTFSYKRDESGTLRELDQRFYEGDL